MKNKRPNSHRYIKHLHTIAYSLWKEVAYKRDGKICMVQKLYPHIEVNHCDVIQVDHCITRANKYFFYDTKNSTVVCATCNRLKHYKQKSVDRAIEEIVKKRNPEWYKKAIWLDQTGEPNTNFNKVWWLEEIIKDLQEEIDELNAKERDNRNSGTGILPSQTEDGL